MNAGASDRDGEDNDRAGKSGDDAIPVTSLAGAAAVR